MDVKYFDDAASSLPEECFAIEPDLGIILGSGWGDSLTCDKTILEIKYSDIPGFGAATVVGHAGEFKLYERAGKRIVAFCGRRHWYEGVGWEGVVLPIELLRRMGCKSVLLTNAVGGINPALHPGEFVILRDHINTISINPLIGPHNPDWGTRFPDLSDIYTKELRDKLHASAREMGLRIMEGVYAFTSGPVFETPAEIQAYKLWGADVVGMSTVPEATFAHACGMKVAGLSLVANLAAGISERTLSHADVLEATNAARSRMVDLIDRFIALLG
jgi:purine-nucleoside phosphorylase